MTILSGNFAQAREKVEGYEEESKKYELSICALFRNEARYLKEWIEYHKLVGVDHFYLYNNDSTDAFKEVLKPYIKKGIVTLVNWHTRVRYSFNEEDNVFIWSLGTQVPAYENAAKIRAVNETKWLVFLDIDEFLVPTSGTKLNRILKKYDKFPGVTLSSDYFDASTVDTLPRRKLVIETLQLTSPPVENPQKGVEKSIIKPELTDSFLWPPYKCRFKDNTDAVEISRNEIRINRYTNRYKSYLQLLGKVKTKLHVDNRMLYDGETKELLKMGYEIEDQEKQIYRFVPEMLKRMEYKSEWDW